MIVSQRRKAAMNIQDTPTCRGVATPWRDMFLKIAEKLNK